VLVYAGELVAMYVVEASFGWAAYTITVPLLVPAAVGVVVVLPPVPYVVVTVW